MYKIKEIDDDNFLLCAMKNYDNVQCNTLDEFNNDLYKFICIKKLIDKYRSSGNLNIRLLLNHIIILFNSFGLITVDFFRYKSMGDNKYLSVIKSFLLYLKVIESDDWNDIMEDVKILNELRKI